jgi:hypothetical protein
MQNDQASSQKLPKNSLNQTQIKATASTQYQDQTSSKVEARYKEH